MTPPARCRTRPRSTRRAFATLAALFLVVATVQAVVLASPAGAATVGFGKSTLVGTVAKDRATSLQFGPDGRLYVLHQDGTINIYAVVRRGANDYAVTSTATTTSVKNIPNHDDDGAPSNAAQPGSCTAPLPHGHRHAGHGHRRPAGRLRVVERPSVRQRRVG